nr:hypothetical protein [Tanacetum cinerariifolium]
QTSGSGNTFLLPVAFFFRQWEVPSGSGNFLTSSGNALMRTVTVPLTGIVRTSRMAIELAIGEVMVVQLDMAVIMIPVLNLLYVDAELPCQLGSGAIGSLEHPISSLSVDGSLTPNGGSFREWTSPVLKGFMGHFV